MENIWSENKYINVTINALLFLLGLNFMHYGQFVLPVICIILFIDRKLNFKVNNIKMFIILCLFALSFFVFSYKQGFYSVMGFCLPMAYYIGSNINKTNEDSIRKVIYVIAFGMSVHVVLNFIVDILIKKSIIFYSSSHYDIWTLSKISTTATVTNYIFIIGLLFYLLFIENSIKIRIVSLIIFTIMMIYDIALGQRTVVFMLLISCLTFICINKRNKNNQKMDVSKYDKYIIIILLTTILVFAILKILNVPFFHAGFLNSRLFTKLFNKGLKTERFEILIETFKLMPKHIFGNCEISSVLGIMPHNLWLDVYDWGGLISFLFIVTHTIQFIIVLIKVYKNKNISKEFKLLVVSLFLCIGIEMLIEPIMSGASIFFICTIITEALIEKMDIYAK